MNGVMAVYVGSAQMIAMGWQDWWCES